MKEGRKTEKIEAVVRREMKQDEGRRRSGEKRR